MFYKKTLELNLRDTQVRGRLETQLNKRRPVGKVEENTFSLFKCLGSMDQGGFFYFHIAGSYEKTESGSRLTYRVLPDTATCGILLVITIALITVLASLLTGRFNGDLALTVVAVNVIMWGYAIWGIRDLSERFEALFHTKDA